MNMTEAAQEKEPLLVPKEGPKSDVIDDKVPLADLVRARNCFFWWTFVGYICWGILTELYSNIFHDVIDASSYKKVTLRPEIIF